MFTNATIGVYEVVALLPSFLQKIPRLAGHGPAHIINANSSMFSNGDQKKLLIRPYVTEEMMKMAMIQNSNNDLNALQKLLSNGSVKPIVDSVSKFGDALSAYERILTSRTRKIAVGIDQAWKS
ncbi:hypothetical protein BDQ12DRAFT_663107 [Crucibulum laeve]|uniref:Uncharacterized protein n=1 Tax=Crucibulum laeve TaxID=68775 RepID=A0A5C3MCV0_9AGAR|nr:hypothetical protein BDQ12DRAFT_663107 [Crucibulum laeve]